MKVVIAQDFIDLYGGAERVTAHLAAAFPDAPVYAVLARPSTVKRMGVEDRLHATIRPRPKLLSHFRLATPVLPGLVRAAALPDADLLITSSYAFSLQFRTRNRAPQLCYCHSPLRFAWTMTDHYRSNWAPGRLRGAAFDAVAGAMRHADRAAARRVRRFITQSPYVADQIARFYGRPADVIGAPVDCETFHPAKDPERFGDYYLFAGRLVEPYKRGLDTVRAFSQIPDRLVVAGDGPALPALRAAAPANVTFTGELTDQDLVRVMQRCRALVFPSRDDFGLLPLEVMACGRPVIAYAEGGARHTVVPGVTGELFAHQGPAAIAAAVTSFDPTAYSSEAIRAHVQQWDSSRFRDRVVAVAQATASGEG